MAERANSNSAVELIIFIKTPARWSGSHVAARDFGSAAGTFIGDNKREQLGKSLGLELEWLPGRTLFVTGGVNLRLSSVGVEG